MILALNPRTIKEHFARILHGKICAKVRKNIKSNELTLKGLMLGDAFEVKKPFNFNTFKRGFLVRQEGKGLNCQFNSLSDEEWSNLFDTLEEWERYLAQLDSKSLRCEDEHFRP